MDWNGDGKYDWKDDAFYNNVIDNKENGQNQDHRDALNNHNYSNNDSGCSGWVVVGVIAFIVYIIAKLLG